MTQIENIPNNLQLRVLGIAIVFYVNQIDEESSI